MKGLKPKNAKAFENTTFQILNITLLNTTYHSIGEVSDTDMMWSKAIQFERKATVGLLQEVTLAFLRV